MTQETEQLSPCAIDETVTLSEVLTFHLSLLVAWTLKGHTWTVKPRVVGIGMGAAAVESSARPVPLPTWLRLSEWGSKRLLTPALGRRRWQAKQGLLCGGQRRLHQQQWPSPSGSSKMT